MDKARGNTWELCNLRQIEVKQILGSAKLFWERLYALLILSILDLAHLNLLFFKSALIFHSTWLWVNWKKKHYYSAPNPPENLKFEMWVPESTFHEPLRRIKIWVSLSSTRTRRKSRMCSFFWKVMETNQRFTYNERRYNEDFFLKFLQLIFVKN